MNKDFKKNRPTTAWWILAYLISPGLGFVCLRVSKVVGNLECILGVLAGMIAHLGLVSVLVKTNAVGQPLQSFIAVLMACSIYLIFMWQYLAGLRRGLWSENARKQWRFVGRVFGVLLGLSVVISIILFHLTELS